MNDAVAFGTLASLSMIRYLSMVRLLPLIAVYAAGAAKTGKILVAAISAALAKANILDFIVFVPPVLRRFSFQNL